MAIENRFNLVDEPWIPVVGAGLASLKDIFTKPHYKALGGNPVQKIALTKLLLAICQTAATPEDDDDWAKVGSDGMAEKAAKYLEEKKDCFWLYGEKPFLQMSSISKAEIQKFGAVLPSISTGNSTVLTQSQHEQPLSDAERAILIVQLMGFALSGKKTDNSIVLTPGYMGKFNDKGKPGTGKSGPPLAFMGLLHSHLLGSDLLTTLWLNLFTMENIRALEVYPDGIGIPPWERMPAGEACAEALSLKKTLVGRLVPVSRFLLLTENGLHYSEGINHPNHKDGVVDPTVAVDYSGKDAKVLWCDPEKRPWRSLISLLSFFGSEKKGSYDCYQIKLCIPRARRQAKHIGVWSGGLRVSSNAGEQYVSGSDDFVESEIMLESQILGEVWFTQLKAEMNDLDSLSKTVYGCVMAFYKDQKSDGADQAAQAANLFWQYSEGKFQKLVNSCDAKEKVAVLRKSFAKFVDKAYNTSCPKDTARQLDAWAKNRPNVGWYLRGETPKSKESKSKKAAKKKELS